MPQDEVNNNEFIMILKKKNSLIIFYRLLGHQLIFWEKGLGGEREPYPTFFGMKYIPKLPKIDEIRSSHLCKNHS